jgi:hypothetical protein
MPNLTLAKNWILGERSLTYEATLSLAPGALSEIVDGAVRHIAPVLTQPSHHQEMVDLKGRDPHDTLLPGIATPHSDEVFRIGGLCAVAERGSEFEWEPFEVTYLSPFKRFEGSHHIVHTLEVERAGALPSWLPTRLLGVAAPIKPRFFRLGIEHFRSILSFASIGYTPEVKESLLIDCVDNTLALKLTAEFKRWEESNPFQSISHYNTLSETLLRATGFNLRDDFEKRLASVRA